MARHPEGWKLRKPKGRRVYIVRFTHNGRAIDRSTGTEDPRQAPKEAARIYAEYVQREPPKRRIVRRGDSPPLPELVEQWLSTDTTIDEGTVDTWTVYGGHWSERWPTARDIDEITAEAYRNDRLRVVLASTVRKELSALRRFIRWCVRFGHLGREVLVAGVPTSATGTKYRLRRRTAAPELTPRQTKALVAALPDWSSSKKVAPFPIRARFEVAYETSLRPSTLDALSVPEHYQRGAPTLTLTDEADKMRWGRELPLSRPARRALDRVLSELDGQAKAAGRERHEGAIFGSHDYRPALARAASKALPAHLRERFNGAHLRSARITHLLEETGNLPGVQYLAGHKLVSTTARYAKPSFRAAEAALGFRGRSADSGDARRRRKA